jgi:predicted dehydrogenase/nucleoside-diphosphate-sugar epimerase
MAQDNPRLAIVGCGAVVAYHLLPALKRIGWLPRVLVDPAPERLKIVARRMGGAGKGAVKASDWRPVANEFDAALIAAPHALHGPLGLAMLEAGKHVFMEKPLGTTSGECRALTEKARASGLALSVGLLRRYLQISRWTKALLESGVLGAIQRFEVREGFVFNWATSSDGLLRPEMAGGGVLMDTGAHTIDLIQWWLGEMDVIRYRDDGESGVEADCVLEVRTKSGAIGRIELSRTRDLRNGIRIEGANGFVHVHLSKNQVFAGSPNALAFRIDGIGPQNMRPQLFPELFDGELTDFRTSILSGRPVGVPGSEGARSVEFIEKCYRVRQPLPAPWAEVEIPRGADATVAGPSIPKGSTVVITGATGFIGGRLAERLVHEHGAKVRCLVREVGHAMRLARLPVEIVHADLTDAKSVSDAVRDADYVFHCAYDPRSRRQNIEGARNLVEASLTHNVRRLVHVSTFSVYEPFPDGPLTEATRDGDPSWVYVRTKLDLEKELLFAAKTRDVPVTIVQPAIVYGPYGKPWTNAPAENLIFGDVILPDRGEGLCNAVYIDDLVDGLVLVAGHPAAIGERFILSGPEPVSWGTFFESFARALKVKPPVYWPAQRIAKANHGVLRDIRLVAANPKRIVQIAVRWNIVRQALQAGLDAMPTALRDLVNKYYFGAGGRRPGELTLPDPQALALFTSKAVVDNGKARRLLDYEPRYDFKAGMKPTQCYLEWAFGDIRASVVRPARSRIGEAPVTEERAHVG